MTDLWERRDWSRGVEPVRQGILADALYKSSGLRIDNRRSTGIAVPCVENGNRTCQSTKETYPTRKVLLSVSTEE